MDDLRLQFLRPEATLPLSAFPPLPNRYHLPLVCPQLADRDVGSLDSDAIRGDGANRLPVLEVHPADLQGLFASCLDALSIVVESGALRRRDHLPALISVDKLWCDICCRARPDQRRFLIVTT